LLRCDAVPGKQKIVVGWLQHFLLLAAKNYFAKHILEDRKTHGTDAFADAATAICC